MKTYLVILFALAMILSACSPAKSAPSLTGTTWKLASYGSLSTQKPVVAEEGFLTFRQDGKFTGIGACNRFEGNYEVKKNQILLSSIVWDVGGNVFCPEPQMSQESGVYDVLKGTVDFKVETTTLTITRPLSETAAFVLVFEAVSDSAAASGSAEITVLQDYFQALTAGDIDKAMSYVADDAVFIDPMGKYVGREQVRAEYEPQMNRGGKWEATNIRDTNGKGRLVYDYRAYINDVSVYSGEGLTVIKDGKIIFDGSEFTWEGECKRDPSQSFCSD